MIVKPRGYFAKLPGGDSQAVQGSLQKVQQLQATRSAFAAITLDGSVVAWGDVDGLSAGIWNLDD